jgi:hypothetical protein
MAPFSGCTTVEDVFGPWCATATNEVGEMINWAHCDCTAAPATDPTGCSKGDVAVDHSCYPKCDDEGGYTFEPAATSCTFASCKVPVADQMPLRFKRVSTLAQKVHLDANENRISLRFRTTSSCGLIFFVGPADQITGSDRLSLVLQDGHLHFAYFLGSGEVMVTSKASGARLDDGLWHKVSITRNQLVASLTIDARPPIEGSAAAYYPWAPQLDVSGIVELGNAEYARSFVNGKQASCTVGFDGCLTDVKFDGSRIGYASANITIKVERCSMMSCDRSMMSVQCPDQQARCPLDKLDDSTPQFECGCSAECVNCDEEGRCLKCAEGTLVYGGSCVTSCPTGFTASATYRGTCIAVPLAPCMDGESGCTTCGDNSTVACIECSKDQILHKGECTPSCPFPFTMTGTLGVDAACSDPCSAGMHCEQCATHNIGDGEEILCNRCDSGWTLTAGQCIKLTDKAAGAHCEKSYTKSRLQVINPGFEAESVTNRAVPGWETVTEDGAGVMTIDAMGSRAWISVGVLSQTLTTVPIDGEKYAVSVNVGTDASYVAGRYRVRLMSGVYTLAEATGEVVPGAPKKTITLSAFGREAYSQPLVVWLEGVRPNTDSMPEGFLVTFDDIEVAAYEYRCAATDW